VSMSAFSTPKYRPTLSSTRVPNSLKIDAGTLGMAIVPRESRVAAWSVARPTRPANTFAVTQGYDLKVRA
jgi:hypothetical protein